MRYADMVEPGGHAGGGAWLMGVFRKGVPVELVTRDVMKRRAMVSALVVADVTRCVECGICSYNCPVGIDVRRHVRLEVPIADKACLTCGECVARCPRNTLRFEETSVFSDRLPGAS